MTPSQRQALDAGRRKRNELARRRRQLFALEIRMLAEYSLLALHGRGQSRRIVELMERIHGERVVSEWTVRRVLRQAA